MLSEMHAIAIRADSLSKKYQIAAVNAAHDTLRDQVADGFRNLLRRDGARGGQVTIWALRGVSFEIPKGQIVGIIGRNGAGKSTLLKILSRITAPSGGRAEIHGRLGSLLDVGTGFHPELTGRENIYLNGAVLGMRKREIDRKFDQIVAFSEIGDFIDTPVKRYSSGMHVRLAFAVAAHLEPDILLVDEVLAVGDVAFQRKSLGKMSSVAHEGRTVLFVSHNMSAIQNICNRALVLQQGRIVFDGSADRAVREYLGYLSSTADRAFGDNPERRGDGRIRFTGARILDDVDQVSESLIAGRPATFVFEYENPQGIKRATWGMVIYNQYGVAVASFDCLFTQAEALELTEKGKLICHIPNLPLPIGQYRVLVVIGAGGRLADSIPNAIVFEVESSVFFKSAYPPQAERSACMVLHEWRHQTGKGLSV